MGLTKEVKIHYTCDSKKCNTHGTIEKAPDAPSVPEGWMWLSITHPKQSMPGLLKSLLCPQCVAKMCSILNGKREEKEAAA